MHQNFYHWHSRAELQPEIAILEPRWNAAAAFAEKLPNADLRSLLRLVLFPDAQPEFAKRFSDALVKLDPRFPPENNAGLLRVMATAAVHSGMKDGTYASLALALGLQAASFPQGRTDPVCQDILIRSSEYLTEMSERWRPAFETSSLAEAEKKAEKHFTALKAAVATNSPADVGKTTEALGRAVLSAMKESHQQLAEVIRRLTEESQFLWWLVGLRSPALDVCRKLLTPEAYALPAAAEAAKRVTLLPPPASAESLLSEALAQCGKRGSASAPLPDLIGAVPNEWLQRTVITTSDPELTPIASLIALRKQGGKADATALKKLRISAKTKFTPADLSRQYFRELMFLSPLAVVS
jgi:hypothetical protein